MRPQFKHMIAVARLPSKPFDTILVYKYSRFSRNQWDSMLYKALLAKVSVKLISITELVEDSATGRLMESLIECFNEFYSANLSEEVTRGMRESASRGFYVKSYAPYGYQKVKVSDGGKERPTLVPDPHKAPVVVRMFNEAPEGKGLKEIVKGLNDEGIASHKGKGWIKTTVHKILTNEAYTGTLVWAKKNKQGQPPIIVQNAWPAIIESALFDRVQVLLKERAPAYLHPKRTTSHFLLSGIAKCGHCGKALVGHDAKGGKFSYYVCGSLLKKGSGSCPARYINGKKLEAAVIDKIKEEILIEKNLTELMKIVNEEMDASAAENHEKLATITQAEVDVNRRLERLYNALETGTLQLEDLAPRKKEQRQRQENLRITRSQLELELSDKRVHIADLRTVTNYVKDLHGLLKESNLNEKKSFIRSFVREARITGNDVLLTYTIPLVPGMQTKEEMAVPPIVQHGGPVWTVPELVFEKKSLIPALQHLLVSYCT